MGYKLAGCEVLGCVEIDPKINEIYVRNHYPTYNYVMDIRDFNRIPNEDLPDELFHLDILDGSPPCTTFSTASKREKTWGKKKKFREGQVEQTLDDLSFVFIETAKKLKPRFVVMENVEGLMLGNAFEYVKRIYQCFSDAGYMVKHWLLKCENMGVPQKRHRVIFLAAQTDENVNLERIDMAFNYEQVLYSEIKEGDAFPMRDGISTRAMRSATKSDHSVMDTIQRLGENRITGFNDHYAWPDEVLPTVRTTKLLDPIECARVSNETIRNAQTFPTDYDFVSYTRSHVNYICGMSVPPVMMKRFVMRLIDQGGLK
jgi:DNA (cytosine-5)-methyltransferase 1